MDESPDNSSTVEGASDSCVESGWTQYLVDLPSSNGEYSSSNCSTLFDVSSASSSLISAASTGRRRTGAGNGVDACSFVDHQRKFQKKLRFTKSRREEITYQDDSLEDTATSPVSRPKADNLELHHVKQEDFQTCPKPSLSDHSKFLPTFFKQFV